MATLMSSLATAQGIKIICGRVARVLASADYLWIPSFWRACQAAKQAKSKIIFDSAEQRVEHPRNKGLQAILASANSPDMLSGPRQKFCEGIVSGLSATAAYVAAYPKAKPAEAAKNTSRLTKSDEIQAEITRLRRAAESVPGHAVLTLAEKRSALAGIVRAKGGAYNGNEMRVSDIVAAVKADNDLAGEGSEAKGSEGLAALILRLRK